MTYAEPLTRTAGQGEVGLQHRPPRTGPVTDGAHGPVRETGRPRDRRHRRPGAPPEGTR